MRDGLPHACRGSETRHCPNATIDLRSHRKPRAIAIGVACAALLQTSACADSGEDLADAPAASAAAADTALARGRDAGDQATRPDEIYFDLTAFQWYREGRPLMHDGRGYMPQADPIPVTVELREAGRYEGVAYYVMAGAHEPVYTLYVPVYYRYWQRFTAPPGS